MKLKKLTGKEEVDIIVVGVDCDDEVGYEVAYSGELCNCLTKFDRNYMDGEQAMFLTGEFDLGNKVNYKKFLKLYQKTLSNFDVSEFRINFRDESIDLIDYDFRKIRVLPDIHV